MNKLNVGDVIKCADKDDLLKVMKELTCLGYESDWTYEHKGETGLWCEIKSVPGGNAE